MKFNPGYVLLTTIFIFGVLGVLFVALQPNHQYEMPNGVICEKEWSTGFSSLHEFYDCEDGKTYLNPEYWTEIKVKKNGGKK